MTAVRFVIAAPLLLLLSACPPAETGDDGGTQGTVDAGRDAGVDAGADVPPDAGSEEPPDAGVEPPLDGGTDAGVANRAPVFDAIDPITLNEGASLAVPLVASDPDGDAIVFALVNPPAFASLTSGSTLQLSPTPAHAGTYAFVIRASDGDLSAERSVSITVVDVPQLFGTISINAGAAYTNTRSVALTLEASGPSPLATMSVSHDGISWSAAEPYASSKAGWMLLQGATSTGVRTVRVRFIDEAGATAEASDTITLDMVPPTINTFSAGAGSYLSSLDTTLLVDVSDPVSGIARTEVDDGNGYADVSAPWGYRLSDYEGYHAVTLRVFDGAGNSATRTSYKTVDLNPPTHTGVVVAGGRAWVNSNRVTVEFTGVSDGTGSGVVEYCITGSGSLSSPQCVGDELFELSPGAGTKTFTAYVKDRVGRTSTPTAGSIQVDLTPPVFSSVVINGGAAKATSLDVTLDLSASDNVGLASVEVSNDGMTFTSQPYAASVPHRLTEGEDGARTVTVRVVDSGGNVTSTLSDSIVVDRTPPRFSIDVEGGRRATASTSLQLTTLISEDPSSITQAVLVQPASDLTPATPASFGAFVANRSVTLAAVEGEYALYVWLRDDVGLISGPLAWVIRYDQTPPQVIASDPAAGAAGVLANVRPTVTFSEAMDPATVVPAAFSLAGVAPTTADYDPLRRMVTLTPAADLAPGSSTLTVQPTVTDLAGNPMAAAHSLSFVTGTARALTAATSPSYDDVRQATNDTGTLVVSRQFNGMSSVLTWAHRAPQGWTSGVLGVGTFDPVYQGPGEGQLFAWGDRFVAVWNDPDKVRRWAIFEEGRWRFPSVSPPLARLSGFGERLVAAFDGSAAVSFFDGAQWSAPVPSPTVGSAVDVKAHAHEEELLLTWLDTYTNMGSAQYRYTLRARLWKHGAWGPVEAIRYVNTSFYANDPARVDSVHHNGTTWMLTHIGNTAGAVEVRHPTAGAWTQLSLGSGTVRAQLAGRGAWTSVAVSGNGRAKVHLHDGAQWLTGAAILDQSGGGATVAPTTTGLLAVHSNAGGLQSWVFNVATRTWTSAGEAYDDVGSYTPYTAAISNLVTAGEDALLAFDHRGTASVALRTGGSWVTLPLHGGVFNGRPVAIGVSGLEALYPEGRALRRRSVSGTTLAPEVQVASAVFGGAATLFNDNGDTRPPAPRIASAGGTSLAVWQQFDAGSYDLFASFHDGAAWGTPFRVVKSSQLRDVASNGSSFVIAFTSKGSGGGTWGRVVRYSPVDGLGAPVTMGSGNQSVEGATQVASDGSGYLVVWTHSTNYNRFELQAVTSPDGVTWSAPTIISEVIAVYSQPWWRVVLSGSPAGYVMYGQPASNSAGFNPRARVLTAAGWSDPLPVTGRCTTAASSVLALLCDAGGVFTAHVHSGGAWSSTQLNTSSVTGASAVAASSTGLRATYGAFTHSWDSTSGWSAGAELTGLEASSMASDGSEYLAVGLTSEGDLRGWRSAGGVLADDGLLEASPGAVEHPFVAHEGSQYFVIWLQRESSQLGRDVIVTAE